MPRTARRSPLNLEALEDRTTPATFTVTTLTDDGPGSLRDAIAQANADTDLDTIVFARLIRGGTVRLSTPDPATTADASAEKLAGRSALVVRTFVTIDGTGETITRSGSDDFRLFQVTA